MRDVSGALSLNRSRLYLDGIVYSLIDIFVIVFCAEFQLQLLLVRRCCFVYFFITMCIVSSSSHFNYYHYYCIPSMLDGSNGVNFVDLRSVFGGRNKHVVFDHM